MKTNKFTVMDQINKLAGKEVITQYNICNEYKNLLLIDFYSPSPFKKFVNELIFLLKDKHIPAIRLCAPFKAVMAFNSDLLLKEIQQLNTEDMLYIDDFLDKINKK